MMQNVPTLWNQAARKKLYAHRTTGNALCLGKHIPVMLLQGDSL